MTEPSESGLIKRAQRGDRSAFEALLRTRYDTMYRMAYKWCGNKADAEDVTQTACIKLARAIEPSCYQAASNTEPRAISPTSTRSSGSATSCPIRTARP